MSLSFEINEIGFQKEDYNFLKIGAEATQDTITTEQFKESKKEKIAGLWATLGWRDDRPLVGNGNVIFSENGNDKHRGVTKDLAENINRQNPDIEDVTQITERFIDLTQVEFQNLPSEITHEEEIHLRLELFLEKDEGALVYLQDNPKGIMNSDNSLVNLVTPEATLNHSQERTSLSYFFPFSFGRELKYENEKVIITDKSEVMPTVIKVLTFIRKPRTPEEYLETVKKELNKPLVHAVQSGINKFIGDKKYNFIRFNPDKTGEDSLEFIENLQSIDTTKKTLLLIHGTFSTVDKSYKELTEQTILENGLSISPFQKLIKDGVFEQIIGFNHPTASHSINENINSFFSLFANVHFDKSISIITTSRGALLAETLLCDSRTENHFKIEKVMTFAAAHGSHLLIIAKGLDRFLSFLRKKTSASAWGYVLALAQFSVEVIRTQPGLNDMLPNSPKILELLDSEPEFNVEIQAMVGDFDKSLVSKPVLRIASNGLDALLRLAFKSETDWVIGCEQQRMKITHPKAQYRPSFEMYCIHGMQFNTEHPLKNGKHVQMVDEFIRFFA